MAQAAELAGVAALRIEGVDNLKATRIHYRGLLAMADCLTPGDGCIATSVVHN